MGRRIEDEADPLARRLGMTNAASTCHGTRVAGAAWGGACRPTAYSVDGTAPCGEEGGVCVWLSLGAPNLSF